MPIDLLEVPLPVTLRPDSPMSDEALMRFSSENSPYRIERNKEGEIRIMTPVGGIGGNHEKYVIMMLGLWTEQDGTGIDFSSNIGFNLPDGSCLSPDASWVSLDRWNQLTPKQQAGFPPLCPEFLIEVRSQTDRRRTLEAKMQAWLDNGARLAWLIDPLDGNVTIYRPGHATQTLERPDIVAADEPVAGFELRCTRFWTL